MSYKWHSKLHYLHKETCAFLDKAVLLLYIILYCIVLYCIVLYCTIYGVTLMERYIASWERYVAIWERSVALWENNVTNVVSTQRHIKLLMICITVKPVEERENFVKNCVIGLNLVIIYMIT